MKRNLATAAAKDKLDQAARVVKNVTGYVSNHGVGDGLMDLIKKQLSEFEKTDINLAVTGQSGAGKSSLINCLRNLRPGQANAANVGCTETTMEVVPYQHPEMPKMILWDLPGVNTVNFPKKTYLEKVGIRRFDALIICTSTRFMENDLWLAQKATELKIPYYCVRTKIDIDVMNDKDDMEDKHDEQNLLQTMKAEIQVQMKKAGLSADKVYLVSTKIKHQTKWDFDFFQRELVEDAPTKNRLALVMALVAGSEKCIDDKRDQFANRIEEVVTQAAGNPGREIDILQSELDQYRKRFGINEKNLKAWNVKMDSLKKELKDISGELDHLDELMKNRLEELDTISKQNIPDQSSVPAEVSLIPIVGPLAVMIGRIVDSAKRSVFAKQKAADISQAKEDIHKVKQMKEKAEMEAEEKRRETVLKVSKDLLEETLKHYTELAKGILHKRKENLM